MQHMTKSALLASATLLVTKGDDDDVDAVVTKALDDLTKSVDDRLKAIETKTDTSKLDQRIKELETKANRPGSVEKDTKEADEAERKSFGTYLRLGNAAPAEDIKTLTVSSDPQGGYLAPKEMSSEFVRELTLVSPIRSLASVRTTGAPSVSYPKRSAITNAKWKGEAQAQEASEPAFGQTEIPVREINTYVDISNQLLADSAGVAETEVRLALAEDFAAKEGKAFVIGNGVLEPEGFLTNADIASSVSAAATDVSFDDLITLMYLLPAAYRGAGSWTMNANTLAKIRKIKDAGGNYIWQMGDVQGNQPESILGRPVVEVPDMPDIAANATAIVFGDFTGYRIVDRIDMSILVNPYILATNGITRIHATRRVGGGVIQASKFKKLKQKAS